MSDPRETALAAWTAPDSEGWRRLDPRISLLTGARAIGSAALPAIPALLGLAGRLGRWAVVAVAAVLVLAGVIGVAHWLTSGYRVTGGRLELRTGVLRRSVQNAPLDRIRTIDLTTPLLHRLLGVTKVSVGTGVDASRIELGAVTRGEAQRLRTVLLPTVRPTPQHTDAVPVAGAPPEDPSTSPAAEEVLAVLDWSWLRFAPLSLARLAFVAGAFTLATQLLPEIDVDEDAAASSFGGWAEHQAVPLLVALLVLTPLVGWLIVAVLGYVLQWGGLRLTRQRRGDRPALHLQAGLVSTRSITIEERRIRGVVLSEPLLLRWAGGAELRTWATGVDEGVAQVLPPCPLPVAREVGARVLETGDPLTAPLRSHGRIARRRAHVRGQWGTLAVLAAAAVLWFVPDVAPAGLVALAAAPVAALLGAVCAEATYRHLGHARTGGTRGHVIVGSGILTRRRTVLETDGVIGWVLRQSLFQRRAGVATLVATTAAGPEQVAVHDIPLPAAIALMDAVTPDLVAAFGSYAPVDRTASARTSAMSSS